MEMAALDDAGAADLALQFTVPAAASMIHALLDRIVRTEADLRAEVQERLAEATKSPSKKKV
jgi:hypothetical protein